MLRPRVSNSITRLGEVEIFAGCRARDLRRIDRLSTPVAVAAGQVLCRPGMVGRECFVLLDADASVVTPRGQIVVPAGLLIGEIALLTADGRRTARVAASADTEALVFSRLEFRELIADLPTVAGRVLHEASRRLIENTYGHGLTPLAATPRGDTHDLVIESAAQIGVLSH